MTDYEEGKIPFLRPLCLATLMGDEFLTTDCTNDRGYWHMK